MAFTDYVGRIALLYAWIYKSPKTMLIKRNMAANHCSMIVILEGLKIGPAEDRHGNGEANRLLNVNVQ